MVVVGGGGAKGKKTHKDDSFLYVFARGNVCLLLGVMWFKSQKQERDAGAGGGAVTCVLYLIIIIIIIL